MHETEIRVRFVELDPYGHANHTAYVTWFEVGRVEALEAIGLPIHQLTVQGVQLVITRIEVEFRQPALAGDRLVVRSAIAQLRRASGTWRQELWRGDVLLAEAAVTSAICGPDGRPTRPPAGLLDVLRSLTL